MKAYHRDDRFLLSLGKALPPPPNVRLCVLLRRSQPAPLLGRLQTASHSQCGPERGSPENTHVLCREIGTPLRSGCLRGLCVASQINSQLILKMFIVSHLQIFNQKKNTS